MHQVIEVEEMAAERLYYNDCYTTVFDATVVKVSKDGLRVWLDRTLFYPPSGGQPGDVGRLSSVDVIDMQEEDGDIVHVLAQPAPAGGVAVSGEIDWPRRYDHMQQHTGQHLLSAAFAEVLDYPTLSFNMGAQVSTIELGAKSLSETDLDRVVTRANELASKAVPVSISYHDAGAVSGLRKASERDGTLRVVEIQGIDKSACGGTHVRSTAELAPIQARGMEKLRGNVRVEFVCGGRAIARARSDFRLLSAAARELGSPFDAVPEAIVRLRQKQAQAEKDTLRLVGEIAGLEAAALYGNTKPNRAGVRFAVVVHGAIDELSRRLAAAFTSMPKAVLVVWAEEARCLLVATSADADQHAGEMLKLLLAKHGGKGGGSAAMAQGSLSADMPAAVLLEELEIASERTAESAAGKE